MGLTATVQAAVDLAFASAGDLVGDMWLTRQIKASYNTATGVATENECRFAFKGVVGSDLSRGSYPRNSSAAVGSDVDSSRLTVYLKPAETEPQIGDVIRVSDNDHRVLDVVAIKPDGDTVLLWELKVAR